MTGAEDSMKSNQLKTRVDGFSLGYWVAMATILILQGESSSLCQALISNLYGRSPSLLSFFFFLFKLKFVWNCRIQKKTNLLKYPKLTHSFENVTTWVFFPISSFDIELDWQTSFVSFFYFLFKLKFDWNCRIQWVFFPERSFDIEFVWRLPPSLLVFLLCIQWTSLITYSKRTHTF